MVDLIYPLKVVGDLEELRYSLRSVHTNARELYDNIWIITQDPLPDWLVNVNVIRAGDGGPPAVDVRSKILAATENPLVADEFVIMNDDFFVVDPIDQWQPFHIGPLSENIARWKRERVSPTWLKCVIATEKWMRQQGYSETMSYHGHVPNVWDKGRVNEVITSCPSNGPFSIIGLYPMCGVGGEGTLGINSKVTTTENFYKKVDVEGFPYLSSSEESFNGGMIGGYIRGMFREPSIYEAS